MISSKSVSRFSSLSILIKAKPGNLPSSLVHWGWKVWKDQSQPTEKSLAACNRFCHCQVVSTICKAIWWFGKLLLAPYPTMNIRRSSGLDNFKLHDLILAIYILESPCKITYHLHLNCTQLLNSHTYIFVFDSKDHNKSL